MEEGDLLHLWFLSYLLIFYALTFVAVVLWERLGARSQGALGRAFGALLGSRWSIPVLWLVTFATMQPMQLGTFDPPHHFRPDLAVLVAYLVFYAFGWGLYFHRDELPRFERHVGLRLTLAAALLVPCALANLQILGARPEPAPLWHLLATASGALVVWLVVFGSIGLFERYFDRPSAVWRYLSDASYWVYLTHLPSVVASSALLTHVALPCGVKFVAVVLFATALPLVTYHYLVRATFIGAALNGRRYERRLEAVPVEQNNGKRGSARGEGAQAVGGTAS